MSSPLSIVDLHVLEMIHAGKIIWTRQGGTAEYQLYQEQARQLIRRGYAQTTQHGCCAGFAMMFILTPEGRNAIHN